MALVQATNALESLGAVFEQVQDSRGEPFYDLLISSISNYETMHSTISKDGFRPHGPLVVDPTPVTLEVHSTILVHSKSVALAFKTYQWDSAEAATTEAIDDLLGTAGGLPGGKSWKEELDPTSPLDAVAWHAGNTVLRYKGMGAALQQKIRTAQDPNGNFCGSHVPWC